MEQKKKPHLCQDDINVVLMPFPTKIKEAVTPNPDATYTIFLNSRLSQSEQEKAYRHALFHIENGDFERVRSVGEIEKTAHEAV